MELLSAVVTTGIYCRPGCAGRPHPGNVRDYALAAAAEADGFRACLRCRPYRAAQPLSWSGPEIVCRAVQLITDGALDGGTEDQLGRRLGVSGRHLRRLFVGELGLTPDQLARSRRAHFARRLLDDTDLTVTDVAFAAGFGSVRQLNRACRDVFRAAPGELRARRRVTDRLVADGGLSLRLPYAGDLDWKALLAYFEARAILGVEAVDGDVYRRTVVVDGRSRGHRAPPGRPRPAPAASAPSPLGAAHSPGAPGAPHPQPRLRPGRTAGAAVPRPALGCAGSCLSRPPAARYLGPVRDRRAGRHWPADLRPSRHHPHRPFGRAGGASRSPVWDRCACPTASRRPTAWPRPTSAGWASPRPASRRFAPSPGPSSDGSVRLDRSAGLDELVASITAIPGLGHWTAHYVALRLGEPDAFPARGRGHPRRPCGQPVPTPDRPPDDRWRPWRALAATYLWAAAQPRVGPGHAQDGPAGGPGQQAPASRRTRRPPSGIQPGAQPPVGAEPVWRASSHGGGGRPVRPFAGDRRRAARRGLAGKATGIMPSMLRPVADVDEWQKCQYVKGYCHRSAPAGADQPRVLAGGRLGRDTGEVACKG